MLQNILSHLSALSSFLPLFIIAVGSWITATLVPWLKAASAKAEAELSSTTTTTQQKFFALLESIASKVSAAVIQAQLPDLISKLQAGTLNSKAAIETELSSLLSAAKAQFITMAGEFGVEASEVSSHVTTLENLIRTELQDITMTLNGQPAVGTAPAVVVQTSSVTTGSGSGSASQARRI